MRGGVEVHEALDAALNAEGYRDHAAFRTVEIRRNEHSRDRVRRLLLRVLDELPEDMTVVEIRDALDE